MNELTSLNAMCEECEVTTTIRLFNTNIIYVNNKYLIHDCECVCKLFDLVYEMSQKRRDVLIVFII